MSSRANLLSKVIDKYCSVWDRQNKLFISIDEENPYPKPEFIDLNLLTSSEKDSLINVKDQPDEYIFRFMYELLGKRFLKTEAKQLSLKKACDKLNFEISQEIPMKDTVDLDRFYYSIPAKIFWPKITRSELKSLYINGFLPHLYWNKGKPRFDSRMWFILDFVLREAKHENGLTLFNGLSVWKPKWYLLSNYLKLTTYMYNSWGLGISIINFTDRIAKKKAWKNEDYRLGTLGLRRKIWTNEGAVIANKIMKQSGLVRDGLSLIAYYRDIFALLSFEAFPGSILIDMFNNPSQRGAVMFSFEPKMKLATYSFDAFNINTYSADSLCGNYGLLFAATDWALSMIDKEHNRCLSDIIDRFRRKENKGEIPCRICGKLFRPKRKIDVTCGKKECIEKNKYLSKRKLPLDTPPIYPE